MKFIHDTETTGFIRKNSPMSDASQPNIVQLSCVLFDEEANRIVQSANLIVCPDGWEIPEDAVAIHGITTEYATQYGMPLKAALDVFLHIWNLHPRVGHNVEFDDFVIGCAIARIYGIEHPLLSHWNSTPASCTMKRAKPIVQAKNVKGALKYPKLTEAYEYFFHKPLDRAHSANADVVATMEIDLALCAMGV